MKPALAAALLLLGTVMPASAKYLCPPGRFTLHAAGVFDGRELVLGLGDASVAGCATVAARDFHEPSGSWLFRVRAKWARCDGRRLALRARFDSRGPYCTRLAGVLRVGRGRRVRFVADRIPQCGNGLRERDEQCDDQGESTCCGLDCRAKTGCPVACDLRDFPCAGDDEICVHTCGGGGVCKPRSDVDCGGGPVCACDEHTMYPDRCAAYEAGTAPLYFGACQRYCTLTNDDACASGEACLFRGDYTCLSWQLGIVRGVCTVVPGSCASVPDAPVCGCDGRTYRNRCELERAGKAPFHVGSCP